MQELAGSFIEGENGELTPNLADAAMKARHDETVKESKQKGKEVPHEQK